MTASSDDPNDFISSLPLTEETTASKRQQLIVSTGGTLTSPSLPTLPFELIAEILFRLPVKLLLQLRCICKSWNSLISDPKFAKKHLRVSTKRHHLIVSSTNNLNEFLLFDSPVSSVFSSSRVKQTQLSYPFTRTNEKYFAPRLSSSCDGILCFAIGHSSAVLWSPSIRKLKKLPHLENPRKRSPFSCFSFGYDHFIDNYKIIGISFCFNQNEVSILTLGADYWRRIQDFPYSSAIRGPGVFVSGTVNWLAYDSSSSSRALVSLDLEKESYQKLPQPNLKNDCWTLEVLRDCLCIFASSKEFLDVWIMKEYGNKESWTKLYNIHYPIDLGLCSHTKTLYVSEDDQMLMVLFELGSNESKLVVYDSKNDTLNIPEIQIINRWMNPGVYIESLISPCS